MNIFWSQRSADWHRPTISTALPSLQKREPTNSDRHSRQQSEQSTVIWWVSLGRCHWVGVTWWGSLGGCHWLGFCMRVLPGRGWPALVACLHRASHLVHPRATVVLVASVDEARLPVHAGLHEEPCGTAAYNMARHGTIQHGMTRHGTMAQVVRWAVR